MQKKTQAESLSCIASSVENQFTAHEARGASQLISCESCIRPFNLCSKCFVMIQEGHRDELHFQIGLHLKSSTFKGQNFH